MGKLISRIMAIALLGVWFSMVYSGNFPPQHRSVGIQSPDSSWGNVIFFVLYVLCSELGKHLDEHPMADYACPIYCDTDHKHIRRSHERITPTEQKSNQEADPELRGPIVLADRKRQEGDL
jgi:hypothetical protein